MNIHNIRMGMATNSSSTHSIVVLPKGFKATDDGPSGEYGWEHFTLTEKDSKKNYLALTLYRSLEETAGEQVAKAVIMGLYGTDFNFNGYVDHQSVLTMPSDWEGKGVNMEFYRDLEAYILREGVAILGGNDNGDSDHPLRSKGSDLLPAGFPTESHPHHLVARKDGDVWVLFNRGTGTKLRLDMSKAA